MGDTSKIAILDGANTGSKPIRKGVKLIVPGPKSHSLQMRWAVIVSAMWCAVTLVLHIKAFSLNSAGNGGNTNESYGSGSDSGFESELIRVGPKNSGTQRLSQQVVGAGVICLILVVAVAMVQLAMLGWIAYRARQSLFWYNTMELVSWISVIVLLNGPVGEAKLGACIWIAVCGLFIYFGQCILATMLLGNPLDEMPQLEIDYDNWGWGRELPNVNQPNVNQRVRKTANSTRMERWCGMRRTHGVAPAIWVGLGFAPLLLRHLPILIVIITALGNGVKVDGTVAIGP
jgi:hypothetical protein